MAAIKEIEVKVEVPSWIWVRGMLIEMEKYVEKLRVLDKHFGPTADLSRGMDKVMEAREPRSSRSKS